MLNAISDRSFLVEKQRQKKLILSALFLPKNIQPNYEIEQLVEKQRQKTHFVRAFSAKKYSNNVSQMGLF
jgi:hypothetical protein